MAGMKFSKTALATAAKNPSIDDVVGLGKGMAAAGAAAKKGSPGTTALLEPNKKQPTGWEPTVGTKAGPKGSKVIARASGPRATPFSKPSQARGVYKTG